MNNLKNKSNRPVRSSEQNSEVCVGTNQDSYIVKESASKVSLTIALPSYNEERTIADVLKTLLTQNRDTFTLEGIIVYADGCTDRTADIVREIQKEAPEVRLMEDTVRKGKVHRLNQMFHDCTSELLMTLDAD